MRVDKLVVALCIVVFAGLPLTASATITSNAYNMRNCTVTHAKAAATAADDCIGRISATGRGLGGPMNPDAGDLNSPLRLHRDSRNGDVKRVRSVVDNDPWNPGAFAHNDWVEAAKYNKGDGSAGELGLIVRGRGTVRQWSVTAPLNGTWVIMVKQSRDVILYLFDNLAGATGGTINLSNFWNADDYSHVSLLTRKGDHPPEGKVPAPGSLALMALGMMTLVAGRRRIGKSVKR
jgi:hypothetical protein